MKIRKLQFIHSVASAILILSLSGCGRDSAVKEMPAEVNLADLSAGAVEKLAYADAHDGTVDQVVEDCASCKLHMKGKAEITAMVGGYTFHCCADRCKVAILTNPEKILASISVDEDKE